MKKLFDVGINDSDGPVVKWGHDGKEIWMCRYYKAWSYMLRRCYHNRSLSLYPTYKDVSVCHDWKTFSNFKSWMEKQDYKGKILDKDLKILGNKLYSPDTCLFIPEFINTAIVISCKSKEGLPLGVTRCGNRYRARCQDYKNGRIHLGMFATPYEAHKEWQIAKIMAIEVLCERYPDFSVYLEKIILKLRKDLDENLQTLNWF